MINFVLGSVLQLGKMELNPVAGLVLLSKASTISDDKPSLADLDSDSDEEDDQGTVVVNHINIVFDQHNHPSKSEFFKYIYLYCLGNLTFVI